MIREPLAVLLEKWRKQAHDYLEPSDDGFDDTCGRDTARADTLLACADDLASVIRGIREQGVPFDALNGQAAGSLCVGEDEKAYDAWMARFRRDNPTYWTERTQHVTLFAHRHNMMRCVESALKPEWEEASRRHHETGNSSWCGVVYEAVQMLRESASPSLVTRQREEEKEEEKMARVVERTDSPLPVTTAGENEVIPPTVSDNQVSNEPEAQGPPWWCETCQSWRFAQPCGRDECPTPAGVA